MSRAAKVALAASAVVVLCVGGVCVTAVQLGSVANTLLGCL